jgi:hypothetical protein
MRTAPPPLKISQIPPLTPQKTSLCRCRHQPSFRTTWNSVETIQIGSLQLGGTLSWLSLGPPTCVVHLLKEKRSKYLLAILEWETKHMHNLLDTQKLYGKLLHTSLAIPAGRAYLTSLEAMLGSFTHSVFVPHSPPCDTPSNLQWWKQQLSHSDISKPIPKPQLPTDYEAYSDDSSGVGVAIMIGDKWQAWQLVPGWKSQSQDIQWAEAIAFELLILGLCTISGLGKHIIIYGDNRGVVEGWWKRSSANKPTNCVFHCILEFAEGCNRTDYIHKIHPKCAESC